MTLISREPWWLVPQSPGSKSRTCTGATWKSTPTVALCSSTSALLTGSWPSARAAAISPTPSRDGSAFQLSQARFQRRNAGFEGFDAVF